MKTIPYNKLVRDKIPELIRQNGETCEISILAPPDHQSKLEEKLVEECNEYLENKKPDELADLLEVIYALAEYQGISIDQLEQLRQQKSKRCGAFKQKILLKSVTVTK